MIPYLTETNKAKPYILAELEAPRVKLSAKKKKKKKKKDLKEHKLMPLLCQHMAVRLQEEEERFVKDPKKEVPTIVIV
jgi:hypothetical protein